MNNTGANTSQHVGGASVPKFIPFEPGTLKETKINICSYEMFEMEMLDRSLVSLQRTEEAYVDINNRIIESVNKRKDRINGINNRVLNLSQKVLALYNANTAMRIMSPSQYPQIQSADLT